MNEPQPISVGRIVHYRLAEHDLAGIQALKGNPVKAGDVRPAMIVETWGKDDTQAVNLQVFLDGPGTYWATSRHMDAETNGSWFWPPRA